MGELALLIFSFCLQAAIGIMLFTALTKQLYPGKQFKAAAIIAAGLSVVGIIASLAHLGRPLSALNSLGNLGSSWLSREVLFAGLFMGITVIYAYIQYFKIEMERLNQILRWAASAVGLLTIFFMGKLYTMASVPVWHGLNTFVDFYATSVAVGALLFMVLSLKELGDVDQRIYGFGVLLAVILQAASAVPYAAGLGLSGMAAQTSAEILSSLSLALGLKWLLILGGAGLLLWPSLQKGIGAKSPNAASGWIYAAGIALVCGQLIGRYIFYAAMIVINIGVT
jgi:anaerobic dimethyl sulfoxide reductase subunit C (anchor subunit)